MADGLLTAEARKRLNLGSVDYGYDASNGSSAAMLPPRKKGEAKKKRALPPAPVTRVERRLSKSQERKLRKLQVRGC